MTAAELRRIVVLTIALLSAASRTVRGQEPGRLEVGGGLLWSGSMSMGARDAIETTGSGGQFRLFATDSQLSAAAGVEARVAVRVTPSLSAGVSAVFARSDLVTAVTSDTEGVPPLETREPVTQLSLAGTASFELRSLRLSNRTTPFVAAGAGLLRHLHDRRTLLDTGAIYHVGGGLTYQLKSGGAGSVKGSGVRLDGRAVIRSGGVALDGGSHVSAGFAAIYYVRF